MKEEIKRKKWGRQGSEDENKRIEGGEGDIRQEEKKDEEGRKMREG